MTWVYRKQNRVRAGIGGDPTLTAQWDFSMGSLVGLKGPTLTFTRASANGSYFDSSGVMQHATTNEARFDHDPSDNTPLGLLIEEARTNDCIRSNEFTNASWGELSGSTIPADYTLNQDVTGVDGTTSAWTWTKITSSKATRRKIDVNGVVGLNEDWCVSVVVKKTTSASSFPGVSFFMAGGTGSGGVRSDYLLNTDAGTMTLRSGQSAATATGIDDWGDFWRFWFVITENGTGYTDMDSEFVPCAAATDTSTWAPTTVTGTSIMQFYQIEKGAYPTSYIPTTTAAVTRAADVCSTTTLDWYAAATGTFYAEASIPQVGTVERTILCIDDGTATDRIRLYMDAAENINFETINSGDTNGASDGAAVIAVDTAFKGAGAYADDDVIGSVNGTNSTQDTSAGIPVTDAATTLRVGRDSVGTPFNGHIKEIKYYNVRKSDVFLTSETA